MFRWLKELFRPSLKCKRIGHKIQKRVRHGMRWPSKFGVADEVTEMGGLCRRCGAQVCPWTETYRAALRGLSMPSDKWAELKAKGELWEYEGAA